jgi:hypothetical protein
MHSYVSWRLSAWALAITLVASAVNVAFAGDELAAETCLRTKVWDGYADGWAIRTMTSTSLTHGATRNYLVTLYKGNDYQIRTCGENRVKNLDLYLYDLNGNVVKRDDTVSREPMLEYAPTATGTFYIVVHARELSDVQKDAGVAMAVTYR